VDPLRGDLVIAGRDVSYTFTNGRGLKPISFEARSGQTSALKGPSGAGKSTLLAVVALLLKPMGGELRVLGKTGQDLQGPGGDALRRTHLGIMLQDPGLMAHLNVWENIALRLGPDLRRHRDRAYEELSSVGLTHLADQHVQELSGGERQRVALARAAVIRPSLLLADEPTGNLDAENGDIVSARLSELAAQGAAVMVATHDERLMKSSDQVLDVDGHVPEQAAQG
jgi:ABC-type lipoprotein export system ATPase subunit